MDRAKVVLFFGTPRRHCFVSGLFYGSGPEECSEKLDKTSRNFSAGIDSARSAVIACWY
jgi:hypothetical protein